MHRLDKSPFNAVPYNLPFVEKDEFISNLSEDELHASLKRLFSNAFDLGYQCFDDIYYVICKKYEACDSKENVWLRTYHTY